MTITRRAVTLALLTAAVPATAQDASDYQLPPAPTPSQDNRAQGPVDPEAPLVTRPRPVPTAAPTPAPTVPPPLVLPDPLPGPIAASPRPRPSPNATAQQPATSPAGSIPSAPPPQSAPRPSDTATLPAAPSSPAGSQAPVIAAETSEPVPWTWLGVGGAALALAAVGLAAIARRRRPVAPESIEPYTPRAADPPRDALALSVEAVRLDRSLMNATVGYRVTLRNRGATALSAVAVEADLVSASRDLPPESQLASAAQSLPVLHRAERLGPGQTMRFEGQVRLPLSQANPIWQGRVGLLVPLLRVRTTAEAVEAVASTLVIGTGDGAGARPQPFRLDEPPRSYAPLAQRVLDPLPLRA